MTLVDLACEISIRDVRDERDPVVRLAGLCDDGTFELREIADGAAYGVGTLDGASAVVFATDARVQGGAMGSDGCGLIVRAYRAAMEVGHSIVGIWQSGGARLQEGAASLDAVGQVFAAMTRASGTIGQVSLVVGPAAGGAAYGPALTDVVIMNPQARVFVTGPDVVRSVTGEDLDAAQLGGPDVHGPISGVAHMTPKSDDEAIHRTRRVVSLLARHPKQQSYWRASALPEGQRDPSMLLPESTRRAYDVRPILDTILDEPGEELHSQWARNIVTVLGRLNGQSVGVIANNPIRMGGALTAPASDKASRFVRLCDALGIPLVVIVDVPGYLPGSRQENDAVVRRGAKLLHAFAAASVPRVTVITRKAYGGAYIAMNSTSLGATKVFAWPGAQVDVMNPIAAVRILKRRALLGLAGTELAEAEAQLAAEHVEVTGGLQTAIEQGLIHSVIDPRQTRAVIAGAIADALPARGNQSNIPL